MFATTFAPTASLAAKLDAIARHAVAGSRHPAIRARAAAAAREAGGDAWDAFASIYDDLRATGVRLPDPGHDAGEDRIEPAHVTLDRRAGDCDDWTVLVLALARALGFLGSVVTLSTQREDGALVPLHVYAEIERTPGVALPADLAESLPLGADPVGSWPTAVEREVWPVESRSDALGFLDGIIGGIAGIFSAKENRRAAREARQGQEAIAAAQRDSAQSAERVADTQARVDMAAIAQRRRESTIDALLTVRAQDAANRGVTRTLDFLREQVPVGVALAALVVLAPLAHTAIGGK